MVVVRPSAAAYKELKEVMARYTDAVCRCIQAKGQYALLIW